MAVEVVLLTSVDLSFASFFPVLLLLEPLFLLLLLVALVAPNNVFDTVGSGMSGRSKSTASDATELEAAVDPDLGLLLLLSSLTGAVKLDNGEQGTEVRDSRAPDVTVEEAADLDLTCLLLLLLFTFFLFFASFSILSWKIESQPSSVKLYLPEPTGATLSLFFLG